MRVALCDCDNTGFPNLALMKLSAWHKARGSLVEWFDKARSYDKIFASKVFTFTQSAVELPSRGVKHGGTGFDASVKLPQGIEHTCPDYSLYGLDYSLGFLTRGCDNKCSWCVVPGKEGSVKANADITEFLRHRDVILMDNNVLQSPHGLAQIEKMASMDLRVDFNQGLDARMIDDATAKLLSKLGWRSPVRLACDHPGMMEVVAKAVRLLRWHNVTPRRYFCYCLVKDVPEAVERVKFLKGIDVDPFAQPYIAPDGAKPTREQRDFARWVNHKAEFKSRSWEDYRDDLLKRRTSKDRRDKLEL